MADQAKDIGVVGESKLYLDPVRSGAPVRRFQIVAGARADSRPADIPPDDDRPHPKIVMMLTHWRELAPAPGLLPGRQHFDPVRVPDLLPHIWLMDVERGERNRYRVRLVGGALVDAGAPMRSGVYLDELGDRIDQKESQVVMDAIVNDRQADWRRGAPIVRHTRYIAQLERALLPFATDGSTVDLIMGVTVFYRSTGEAL